MCDVGLICGESHLHHDGLLALPALGLQMEETYRCVCPMQVCMSPWYVLELAAAAQHRDANSLHMFSSLHRAWRYLVGDISTFALALQ